MMLTSLPRKIIAHCLTKLVQPYAVVNDNRDKWMPQGFLEPDEAKLGEAPDFLSDIEREEVTNWWLKVRRRANTPNWDIISTCTIEEKPGLILVEAKAHSGELKTAGKNTGNLENDNRIKAAIDQANCALNKACPGWNLSKAKHYQLCNRFAWSWKVAELGVPVILVYLGFSNTDEMTSRGKKSFHTAHDWAEAVHHHCLNIVPRDGWEQRLCINGTPMRAVIRSIELCPDIGGPV